MTTAPPPLVSIGLENYLFVVLRQWRVVLVGLLLGVLGGFAFLAIVPTEYTATTTVNLNVITTDPFNPQRPASGLLDDATEADIAQSQVVAQIAQAALPALSATDVRRSSSVDLTSETTIARVSFTSTDPDKAIAGAGAVSSAYLQYRSQQAQERIGASVASLTQRIDALNERLAGANSTIAGNPAASSAATQATTERQQILIELEGLISDRNALQGVDTTGGSVLTPASEDELETAPSRLLSLATGAALGLILGIILAFAVNPLMAKLRGRKEMARATGRPVLALLRSASPGIPPSPDDMDGLRVARERILAETRSGTARILVYDASHSRDVSAAAMGLALVTAQSQRQSLLLAPEVSEAQLAVWRDVLGLTMTKQNEGTVVPATRAPGLSIFVPLSEVSRQGATDSDILMGRDARDAIENVSAGSICFITITAEAHRASLLAALREADAAIILLRTHASTTTEVRDFLQEATNLETPLLGSVVLPRRRGSAPLVPVGADTLPMSAADRSDHLGEDPGDDVDVVDDPVGGSSSIKRQPRGRPTPRRAVDAVVNNPQD